jgi:hypothetical protein
MTVLDGTTIYVIEHRWYGFDRYTTDFIGENPFNPYYLCSKNKELCTNKIKYDPTVLA